MHRFYHSNPLGLNQIITLDEFASHHALRVMRVKVDDFLILFNGDGFEYRGRVSDINKKTNQPYGLDFPVIEEGLAILIKKLSMLKFYLKKKTIVNHL